MIQSVFQAYRAPILFAIMGLLLVAVGVFQSWSLALTILNLCLISAIMSLGVNMQWGYAGLFNAGVMGFAALGGLAAIVISMPPVEETWTVGGAGIFQSLLVVIATVVAVLVIRHQVTGNKSLRNWLTVAAIAVGYVVARMLFGPAVDAIESVDPAKTGYLGGLGLPILFAWVVGGLFAAGAAWIVGKVALGLRSDYLAIATLGISEIVISILKNEEWLTRGVKNVNGLPRPVPFEIELQQAPWVLDLVDRWGFSAAELASIIVKLSYAGLFLVVLLALLFLAERALHSPWGRMMRAIRDNETAASAMGKNVTGRHLEVFILGSAVIGIAGAMLVTIDGQFTPTAYQPLRFTFLIWVMVIVGGAGNNLGSILGGFIVWFTWVQAEPVGAWLLDTITAFMAADDPLRLHLIEGAAYMRPITMGLVLLLVLRFSPRGLIPEQSWKR